MQKYISSNYQKPGERGESTGLKRVFYLASEADARIAELKARLNDEENRHAELQARCFDSGGSQSVFDRVRELEGLLRRSWLRPKESEPNLEGEVMKTLGL